MSGKTLLDKLESIAHTSPHSVAYGRGKGDSRQEDGARLSLFPRGFSAVLIVRLGFALVLFLLGLLLPVTETAKLAIMIASSLASGYDVVLGAALGLAKKRFFDGNLLLTAAVLIAFLIGSSNEAAAVMLLFRLGEMLLEYAVSRTGQSVVSSLGLDEDTVRILRDGREEIVPAADVKEGEIISVLPGERVSLDCVVIEGNPSIDQSAVTGDSLPRQVTEGESIPSGSVNLSSAFKARVSASATDSAAGRILSTLRRAVYREGASGEQITRLTGLVAPVVLILALLRAIIPLLLFDESIAASLRHALVFVVIAYPGTLLVSRAPTYFAGIGGAHGRGILFYSAAALDSIAGLKAVVFDKRGTLSTGRFRVVSAKSERLEADMFLKVAAHAVAGSELPFAAAILSSYDGEIRRELLRDFTEYPEGVRVYVEDIPILVGTRAFLYEKGVDVRDDDGGAELAIFMAVDGIYAGRLLLNDAIREDSADAVRELAELGGERITMLAGDSRENTARFAKAVGIGEYYSECLPSDKTYHIQRLKEQMSDGALVFVGNAGGDTPQHTAADVDMLMSAPGAAPADADVLIMDDKLMKAAVAVLTARRTRRVALENLILVMAVKAVILLLSALGISSEIWFAVFADMSAALAAVLNSFRAFYIPQPGGRA